MKKIITVAVDGPAGSGKSTVCKAAAAAEGLKYIDSGALYRSVTWFCLQQMDSVPENFDFTPVLRNLQLKQLFFDGACRSFVNGTDVSSLIRDEIIVKNIGRVSDNIVVRNFVNEILRSWARSESVIMDGRDIGTVVFPDADVKLYLDASPEIRARRRAAEYRGMGKNVDENSIKKQIIQRDEQDRSRKFGALVKADDALYVDTSDMTAEQVTDFVKEIIKEAEKGISLKESSAFSMVKKMDQLEQVKEDHEETIDMEQVISSTPEIRQGVVYEGRVVAVYSDHAVVAVGAKLDGKVLLSELETNPEINDVISVMLMKGSSRPVDGLYQFSAKLAKQESSWQKFLAANGTPESVVSGKIIEATNKGKIVDCGGFHAFLPFSLSADLKGESSTDEEYSFILKSTDRKKKSAVISRKDFLEAEHKQKWAAFTANHKAGDTVTGVVVKFVEFGAFVRVEGIDALLHRNDMSWKNVFKQRKLLKLNDEREFQILSINVEEEKVSLGLKQLTEDPWTKINEIAPEGSVLKGEIVTIVNTGAFIEINDEIEGFLPNTEVSWTQNSASVKNMFQKGDEISVMVTGINQEERKLLLSHRKTVENPWDSVGKNFPVGSIHKGKIRKIVKFGMFVEISEGIDGLIHVSDITWEENGDPLSSFHTGDEVEFKILSIKKDEMKISCGMKQLVKSPWELISEKYRPKMLVSGTVSGLTQFGVFVKIEDNVEGLVHISEVSRNRIDSLEGVFKVGDPVEATVLGVDIKKKRLSLSIKQFEYAAEREEVNKILRETKPSTVTLGDMIDLKLKK